MEQLEDVRARVARLTPGQRAQLAARAGVPESTLFKFAKGHVREPGYNTVAAVARVLPEFEAESAA